MAKLLLGSVVGPRGPQGTPGVNGSQGPQGIPGPNEIAATTNVTGLTSGQLLYNNGGKVGSVEIMDNLLSIDPDKPLSANQGKVLKSLIDDNSSAIGQLQTDMGNIDVSWDGITGKPTTFAPSTHTHNEYMPTGNAQAYNNYVSGVTDHAQLLWNHGNIIVQTPSASGTPMISFHSQGVTAVGLYEDGCRLYTTGSDGRNSRRLLDTDDYNSLFQSVVNGKQSVVNAINGSLGYASGLTTSNTHDDYAWWIQNKVALVNTIVKKQAATNTAALIVALTKTVYHSVSIAAKTTVSSSVTFTEPCLLYIASKNRNSGGTVFDSVTVPDNTNLLKGPDLTVYSYNTANLVSILAPCTITFSIYNGETNTKTVSNIYKVTV